MASFWNYLGMPSPYLLLTVMNLNWLVKEQEIFPSQICVQAATLPSCSGLCPFWFWKCPRQRWYRLSGHPLSLLDCAWKFLLASLNFSLLNLWRWSIILPLCITENSLVFIFCVLKSKIYYYLIWPLVYHRAVNFILLLLGVTSKW